MIKKGDALIFLPMTYRKFNAHIHIEALARVVAAEDETVSGAVVIRYGGGEGAIDESCLVPEDAFLKIKAYLKENGRTI